MVNDEPRLIEATDKLGVGQSAHLRWQMIVEYLKTNNATPSVFQTAWQRSFAAWDAESNGPAPVWIPDNETVSNSNIGRWIKELGLENYPDFHAWTIENRSKFWNAAAEKLHIDFSRQPTKTLDLTNGPATPVWFSDARLNIAESCFQSPGSAVAIIAQKPGDPIRSITFDQLQRTSNQISNSIVSAGFKPGDAIAVVLPMTALSVSIYLGIVQAGCVVVSIADSFAPPEIASRLNIANAKLVFTYDVQKRAAKKLPLFERVATATDIPAVVLSCNSDSAIAPEDSHKLQVELRDQDLSWDDFLNDDQSFTPVQRDAGDAINILFSSGTTGEPKAIEWNHLTPIKCAIDGYCHQDIRADDVCMWPTNLGWMMGPWLIFASLLNRATIALYEDAPMGAGFGEFVAQAHVTMLGVVPTIVKAWRANREMEPFDWSAIRTFSSTGESSQRDDMVYLSSLAGIKPIIEYCGGTEIGGGYVTSVVTQPNVPAAFNTPAVGIDFVLINEAGNVSDEGEVFLMPPSIGLSQRLINRDHFATYYEGTPEIEGVGQLRRHGDHFRRLPGGFYTAGGRVDDTMNLGGIKISSAEIERVLNQTANVKETAAIANSVSGGPDQLIVFVVGETKIDAGQETELHTQLNQRIKKQLNPLFKIAGIHIVESLPRTASGKVMRRKLRDSLVG